ncbi:hypothetical protein FT643_07425 [Ketobacter sp. MCCC 1A13808]|uniref:hypothetical protein n=1 Tax=Ketobacter sp. MCCC 1A13808 TaxID=2602738 RepID=UPI000F0E888D|nr:hypothetical protein [Ketobacter sp. MCCC 1A13808]MVF11976.1 hypothetical protein [Ketobacter sp. MCCC 1A13808]RLP52921.1 MAG: hypothetical protein D6160_18690 [Ketobacter sp.]
MFKNKHVVVAMIVSPILAIIAYFAVDMMVGEKPKQAQAGQSYSLAALPNCRYPSGHCTLKNGSFEVDIKSEEVGVNVLTLHLTSKHVLQGAKAALVTSPDQAGEPADMTAEDESGFKWRIELEGEQTDDAMIRLVVAAESALYFGETGLAFVQYQTSFGKDFR